MPGGYGMVEENATKDGGDGRGCLFVITLGVANFAVSSADSNSIPVCGSVAFYVFAQTLKNWLRPQVGRFLL